MKRLIRRICWYHYNRYSNPLKILWLINAILFGVCGILKSPTAWIFAGIMYVVFLCDRGFGEPRCPF